MNLLRIPKNPPKKPIDLFLSTIYSAEIISIFIIINNIQMEYLFIPASLPCTSGDHLRLSASRADVAVFGFFLLLLLSVTLPEAALSSALSEKEAWSVHPDFKILTPGTIAVLPMDNFSLEPNVEKALYKEVYDRLQAKGYMKVSVNKVQSVMNRLGIQTPGQIAGISPSRLGRELNCDAVLMGKVEQSASIHNGPYDAVVVSCSLKLLHCPSGTVLWQTEQWRTAHRQWAIDPINLFINFLSHENASREERVAFLAHEMLKTLPQGTIEVKTGDLLQRATEIPVR